MQDSNSLRLALIVAVLAVATVAQAATTIALRETVEMSTNVVRLGDVANIASSDPAEIRRLSTLPLMPAPANGGRRFLRQREIADLLAAHGVDLRSVAIDGADQVAVQGGPAAAPAQSTTITPTSTTRLNRRAALLEGHVTAAQPAQLDSQAIARLNDDVRSLIARHLKTKFREASHYEIHCDVPQRHIMLLHSATSPPVCEGGTAPWTGQQRFELSFNTPSGPAKFHVYAEIVPPAKPVAVTTRAMARGDVITAADIELQDVGRVPTSDRRLPFDSIETLIGMEVRQAIPSGSIVMSDAVQSPILVKRGELITVSSQSGGIRVRTTAKALQDRSRGELVQVESLETKQKFDARVIGIREAAVVVTPPTATASNSATVTVRR